MIFEACGKSANRPLEWTGLLILSAEPPQAPCLPLRGSVSSTVPKAGGSLKIGLRSDPG